MKISVEIDCTPTEARQLFGLPNVDRVQQIVMDKSSSVWSKSQSISRQRRLWGAGYRCCRRTPTGFKRPLPRRWYAISQKTGELHGRSLPKSEN